MKLAAFLTDIIKDSKRMLHVIVLALCIFVSTYQLLGCISKLRHPPVSTHYRFVINETLHYPAVTICRNPAYKADILQSYNLGNENSNVEHTSEWQNFPFENATLEQIWNEATYSEEEIVQLYGLHSSENNVEVKENFYLFYGRCFTFLPKAGSAFPWPNSGWSITLRHSKKKVNTTTVRNTRMGTVWHSNSEGFHVFIHETREPFTENHLQTQYIPQYLYLEVGKELEVKINAEEYRGISTLKRPCLTDINYSRYQCMEKNRWRNLTKNIGCSVPWIRHVSDYPQCSNYTQVKKFITEYRNFSDDTDEGCSMSCTSSIYKLFVINRVPIKKPFSHLYVYYSSKLVTVMQEFPSYDSNTFLADIGGSLGFFLGLSVIGLIGLIEKSLKVVFCYAKPILDNKKTVIALPEPER